MKTRRKTHLFPTEEGATELSGLRNLSPKPCELNMIPKTHEKVEGGNWLHKGADFHKHAVAHTPTLTIHTHIGVKNKRKNYYLRSWQCSH